MKKIMIAIMALSAVACSKVPAGNVGVNEDLFLFPTFTQTDTWEGQQAISFQTSEGLAVNADIGISYYVNPAKVTDVFQKYRKGIDEISDRYLRQMVKDAFVTIGGTKPIESVYGEGKAELIAQVEEQVRRQVAPIGLVVERVYWSAQPRLPDSVNAAINAKITATQKSQQRENEIQQTKAEAQKAIEEANGIATAKLINAEAEAKAIKLKSDALRQSPELVQLTLAEKWNGVLPTVTGGTTPFIDLRAK